MIFYLTAILTIAFMAIILMFYEEPCSRIEKGYDCKNRECKGKEPH